MVDLYCLPYTGTSTVGEIFSSLHFSSCPIIVSSSIASIDDLAEDTSSRDCYHYEWLLCLHLPVHQVCQECCFHHYCHIIPYPNTFDLKDSHCLRLKKTERKITIDLNQEGHLPSDHH